MSERKLVFYTGTGGVKDYIKAVLKELTGKEPTEQKVNTTFNAIKYYPNVASFYGISVSRRFRLPRKLKKKLKKRNYEELG